MLLGISASIVKAIVIKMSIFHDNINEAVRFVDLAVGNIYDLVYESKSGEIYESRAKVVSIEEVEQNVQCKPGCGYVRESIGCHNSICLNTPDTKGDFFNSPPVKKIKIVVDTSETFNGRYETIMLDSIRDCILIDEADTGFDNNDYSVNDNCCSCCHLNNNNGCAGSNKPQINYTYNYPNNCSVQINGEKVLIDIDGTTSEIGLEAVMKYYLGLA